VTNNRVPPSGYSIEFDLGLVHEFGQLGTKRLIASRSGFFLTPFEGEVDEGYSALGHVEQAPLPMLESLDVCRDPVGGGETLVSGVADPLYDGAERLGRVGFVESYPINPRDAPDGRVQRSMITLRRHVDDRAWRHRYDVVAEHDDSDAVALGGIWTTERVGAVELWQLADGTLVSALPLLARHRRRPSVAAARWIAAPLTWDGGKPHLYAMRASGSRLRRVARRQAHPPMTAPDRKRLLGYVMAGPVRGASPLFAARHPVIGDQFVTRSEIEAHDMGYVVEGVLGWVSDSRAQKTIGGPAIWASRFGQRRRYIEGFVADIDG
jgi:hypothetical protein